MIAGFGKRMIALALIAASCAGAAWVLGAPWAAVFVAVIGVIAAWFSGSMVAEQKLAVEEPPAPALPLADELFDAVADPLMVVEAGRVTLANSAALALFGRHIVGQDVRLAIRHPAGVERLAAISVPADQDTDLVGLGSLGQRWAMRVGTTEGGRRVVHLADRTASHAAERMRVDFVANASHELRTPLASLLGFIETLQGDAGETPATRTRFLGIMLGEAKRMQRLVADLISLSRIEAERFRLPDRPVDLGELIEEVCEELQGAPGPRPADIALTVTPNLAPILGDQPQLSQMLHNLIGNALKFGRVGTPVTVSLEPGEGKSLAFIVADHGEGIAPKHLPRLTERFYRADAGRSRALGGTGLGLAIVKHIVERHRGQLAIRSEVGVGTVVTVTLPLAPSSNRNAIVTEPPLSATAESTAQAR